MHPPAFSVVIPTLNEERRIAPALAALLRLRPVPEIVVADGGSGDATLPRARAFAGRGIRVLACSRRGRGPQMNEGAAIARGTTLIFLHADVQLPEDAFSRIEAALGDPAVVAGAFTTHTGRGEEAGRLAPLLRLADLRSRYTRLPYGDQALFIRAERFRALGGYAEIPLMEDLDLARRLRRVGKVVRLRASVSVSGRRFWARPVRAAVSMNLYPILFRLGLSPWLLARLYGHPR